MLINAQRRRIDRVLPHDASLAVDFDRNVAKVAGTVTSAAALLTCTRNTIAWTPSDFGLLEQTPVNTPRLQKRLGLSGLLVERATTNILVAPSDFSNAAWVKANGATATFGASAMDGEPTASHCVDTAAAGSTAGTWTQTVINSATVGLQWTGEIAIRQTTGRRIKLQVAVAGGVAPSFSGGTSLIDTQIGAAISTTSGTTTRVRPGANGYLIVSISFPNNYGGGAYVMLLTRENNAASPIVFDVDRAQLEQASAPSSPIAASRAADVVSIDMTSASWFNAAEGTIVVDAYLDGPPEANQTLLSLAGSGSTWITIARQPYSSGTFVDTISAAIERSGWLQAFGSVNGFGNLPRQACIAVRYKAGAASLAIGNAIADYGVAPYAGGGVIDMLAGGLPGGVPVLTSLQFGHLNGTAQLDGLIRRVAYIPRFVADDASFSALVI